MCEGGGGGQRDTERERERERERVCVCERRERERFTLVKGKCFSYTREGRTIGKMRRCFHYILFHVPPIGRTG